MHPNPNEGQEHLDQHGTIGNDSATGRSFYNALKTVGNHLAVETSLGLSPEWLGSRRTVSSLWLGLLKWRNSGAECGK
jgi:hypothetical protein